MEIKSVGSENASAFIAIQKNLRLSLDSWTSKVKMGMARLDAVRTIEEKVRMILCVC